MQRRLRNTLAIAIAGGAVILGAGTAFAASPADEVAGSAPELGSVTKADKGDKGKGATDELGGATSGLNTDDLTKGGLPTGDLTKGVGGGLPVGG